jgi:hypothetical protein
LENQLPRIKMEIERREEARTATKPTDTIEQENGSGGSAVNHGDSDDDDGDGDKREPNWFEYLFRAEIISYFLWPVFFPQCLW